MSAKTPRADAQKPDEQMQIQEPPLSPQAAQIVAQIEHLERERDRLKAGARQAGEERQSLYARADALGRSGEWAEVPELTARARAAEAEEQRFSSLADMADRALVNPRAELAERLKFDEAARVNARAWEARRG